jgi:hypothetical protein
MDSVTRASGVLAAQEIDQWIDGWSDKMIEIWQEKQLDLQVHDTGDLARSMTEDVQHEGMSAHIVMQFLQYGVYQALGVGYGYIHGNGGDLQFLDPIYRHERHLDEPRKRGKGWGGGYTSGEPRKRRDWITPKLYGSVMKMAEVMAQLTGQMGVALVCDALENARSALKGAARGNRGQGGAVTGGLVIV